MIITLCTFLPCRRRIFYPVVEELYVPLLVDRFRGIGFRGRRFIAGGTDMWGRRINTTTVFMF